MKRLLSVFLLVALLLTFALPLATAQEPAEPETKKITAEAEPMLGKLPTAPAKRTTMPYLETTSLMVDLTVKRGDMSYLTFIGRNPNAVGGYYFGVEVYRGSQITEDTFIGNAAGSLSSSSVFETIIGLDTAEMEMTSGDYTVVYFTLIRSGDNLYVAEETVKTFPLKVVNYDIPLQSLGFYGLENELNMHIMTQTSEISPKLVPSNTTVNRAELSYSIPAPQIFMATCFAGVFRLSATEYGTSYLNIALADKTFSLKVNVNKRPLTHMSFDQPEVTLHADLQTSVRLVLRMEPDAIQREMKIYSENPEIADVEYTGYEFLACYISSTGHNGKTRIVAECEGVKAYCDVTVEPHTGEIVERVEATATQPGYEIVKCEYTNCKNEEKTNILYPVFEDTDSEAWYCDGIDYAYENGLFNGVTPTEFAPNKEMSRAMLVTVLWRIAGEPEAGAPDFTDVKPDLWYSTPIAWAAENKIVTGVGEGLFAPDKNITREQLATILYRYAELTNEDVAPSDDLSDFPDADKVSPWALKAMQWCVARGLIGGSDGKLLPQGNATRAQVATIIMRYLQASAPMPTE